MKIKKTQRRSPIVVKRNGRKEVRAEECSSFKMVSGNEKRLTRVIDDGVVKNWVGIGWVSEGSASEADRGELPHVIRTGS
jgi:hypothetical protein